MKKNKQLLNFLFLILITLIVLYFSLKDHFHEIMDEILNLNPFWVFVAILLSCGYWFFKSIEFCIASRRFKEDFKFRESLRMTLATSFFNGITPFATGGQPFQVYMLKKAGFRITDSTNIIMENFIVYQIALVLLGTIAICANFFGHIFQEAVLLKNLVTLGFFINTIVVIGLFLVAFNQKFNRWITNKVIHIFAKLHLIKNEEKKKQEFEEHIAQFHKGARILLTNKKQFAFAIGLNMIALISQYLIPVALLYSMGDFVSFNGFLSVVTSAYVMLIGSFVPIPGGTGGLEYGFLAFFGNFITGSKLNAIMLLWRALTYYFGLIIGAIAFNMKGKNK